MGRWPRDGGAASELPENSLHSTQPGPRHALQGGHVPGACPRSPAAEGKLTRAGCPRLAPAARPGLWVLQRGHSRRTLKVAPRYSLDKVKEMGTRAHLEQPVADGPAWPPPAHPLSQPVALSTQDTRRTRARAGGDSSAPAQTQVRRGWASRARAGMPGRAVRRRPRVCPSEATGRPRRSAPRGREGTDDPQASPVKGSLIKGSGGQEAAAGGCRLQNSESQAPRLQGPQSLWSPTPHKGPHHLLHAPRHRPSTSSPQRPLLPRARQPQAL